MQDHNHIVHANLVNVGLASYNDMARGVAVCQMHE